MTDREFRQKMDTLGVLYEAGLMSKEEAAEGAKKVMDESKNSEWRIEFND